jgi:hypothetical protein
MWLYGRIQAAVDKIYFERYMVILYLIILSDSLGGCILTKCKIAGTPKSAHLCSFAQYSASKKIPNKFNKSLLCSCIIKNPLLKHIRSSTRSGENTKIFRVLHFVKKIYSRNCHLRYHMEAVHAWQSHDNRVCMYLLILEIVVIITDIFISINSFFKSTSCLLSCGMPLNSPIGSVPKQNPSVY